MMKRTVFSMVFLVAAAFLVSVPGVCLAQPANNTEINKQDQAEKGLTADQQGETKQDREISQKIRRAIVTDKSLSIYAHNVKIITVDGIVTLKGPVRSEQEKKAVEEKAAAITGKGNVKSEIGIAPKNTDK